MEIGQAYSAGGLWNLDALGGIDQEKSAASTRMSGGSGGDTAEISDEARRLFSQMIHRYDRSATDATNHTADDAGQPDGQAANGGASGGGGAGGDSISGNDAESIRKQIQSLKSQLMGLASQLTGGSADAGATSKMDALQSQIAALEAQLNEMEQAG